VLDAILANRTRIITELSSVPEFPPPPPPPPPPPGITLFGDHDPQQDHRPRSLYQVERLEVDSDFDLIPDHVELADPNANPYDVMNAAMTGFPQSATNNIPNAYEELSDAPNGVVINEVSLTGHDVLEDEDGNEPDWFELFNPTNAEIDLNGWQLRDTGSAANWYTFPAQDVWFPGPLVTPDPNVPDDGVLGVRPRWCRLAPGAYVVLLGRDDNFATPRQALSVGFRLDDDTGETIRLMRPNPGQPDPFVMQDEFTTTPVAPNPATPRYGSPGDTEYSFGRAMWALHPPGGGALTYGWFVTPTPGAMNTGPWYEGFCAPIGDVFTFNQDSGQPLQSGVNSRAFGARFGAYITGGDPDEGEFIHYTLNGAEPSPWSAVANAGTGAIDLSPQTPFHVNDPNTWITSRGFVVRARTFKAGYVPGPVITRNFLFKEDVLGRVDDPATPGVDETEPRQTRPAGYPELTPETYTSVINGVEQPPEPIKMRYGVQPAWGSAAERQAIADQLSAAPSIAITLPVADSFDRESAGIIACAHATESALADPRLNGWERAASMQWIFENSVGNAVPLELACGLDVSGRTSLSYLQTLKKGLRLSFKKKYGKGKFVITGLNPVFEGTPLTDEYDEFVLRSQTGDSWQGRYYGMSYASYCRERWARDFMEGAGHRSLKSRHIHVWINGLYWGVYMLSEVASDTTLDARVHAADWQIWKDGGAVHEAPDTAAANTAWQDLTANAAAMATAIQQGGTGDLEWTTLQTLMDVDNFCDYVLINGYMGNWDCLWNNGRMYRDPNPPPGEDSRIRWMIYDAEMGGHPSYLQPNWAGQPGPWTQNATTGEWLRRGWIGLTAENDRCGPRGMILANTTAGGNTVTFPQQVTAAFHGPGGDLGFGASAFRLIGPGIPADARVTAVTSAPGLTTLTLNTNATATQSGVALIHYVSTSSAGALLRDLTYHPGFARRLSARMHRHFYDLRPGREGILSATPLEDRAVTTYTALSGDFAPFKACEYLRWGAGYTSNGSQPTNSWLGTQPAYTTGTFLPQRRGHFTTELQKHPFPPGVQPGPNPQSLYPFLVPGGFRFIEPGDPLPPGQRMVELHPFAGALWPENETVPAGTVMRYTLDGSDPSAVEFPPYSAGIGNDLAGPAGFAATFPAYVVVPVGATLRLRTCQVNYRTAAPPQDSDSVVESIVAESAPGIPFTIPAP